MSKIIYLGNDASIAQRVETIYIGDTTNVARLVQQVFIGDENNTAQLAFCAHEYGEVIYDWDGYDSCTASKTCSLCGHVVSETTYDIRMEYNTDNNSEYDYKAYFNNFESDWHCDGWHSDACNHNWVEISRVEPDCVNIGHVYYECTVCGETYETTLDPIGHDYKSQVIAPTCTEQGYTLYTCSRCGDSYKNNYVDALGHAPGKWQPYDETYCEQRCTRCGIRLESWYHKFGDWYDNGDGNCARECSVCGYKEIKEHEYDGTWIEDGEKYYRVCQICGHYDYCYHDECEWEYDQNDVDQSTSIYHCTNCKTIFDTCQCANETLTDPEHVPNTETHTRQCTKCLKVFIEDCVDSGDGTCICGYEFPPNGEV